MPSSAASTKTTTSSIRTTAFARRMFGQNRCLTGDDKTFERWEEVKDMALKIEKPRVIGHDSLKMVGKTCRISRARRIQNCNPHLGAVLHKMVEDKQPNDPEEKRDGPTGLGLGFSL